MRRARRVLIAGGALAAAAGALHLAAAPQADSSRAPEPRAAAAVSGSGESALAGSGGGGSGGDRRNGTGRAERDAYEPAVRGDAALRSARAGNPTSQARASRDTSTARLGQQDPSEARRDSSLFWPLLDPVDVRPDHLTARITGTDPLADRPLVLWRRSEASAEPIGATSSDRAGRFDFGELPIPNGELQLVVTPAGGDPFAPSPLEAKRQEIVLLVVDDRDSARNAEARRIRVFPSVLAGELLLLGPGGALLDALSLERIPARGLTLDESGLTGVTQIVHALPDGRRSDPIAVGRGAPAPPAN